MKAQKNCRKYELQFHTFFLKTFLVACVNSAESEYGIE
jgi:hypothetical protein